MYKIRFSAAAVVYLLLLFSGIACSPRQRIYMRDPGFELADSLKQTYFVPLDSITVEYVDRTQATPDTLFSDSFFIEAANSLLAFEASKRFSLMAAPEGDEEAAGGMCAKIRAVRYSRLADVDAGGGPEAAATQIRSIAESTAADLILIAYSCRLKHILYQPQGWRGSGPSYQRPVTFKAYATTHVQIWNRDGELLYEKIGGSDAGRPIMYSLFGKKKPENDVVKFAKNLYAPPLVRAMYMSIQEALRMPR